MSIERPSRRTVIKAGVWTAPAVVAVGAAPAYAAVSNPRHLAYREISTSVRTGYTSYLDASFQIEPDTSEGVPIDQLAFTFTATSQDGTPISVARLRNAETLNPCYSLDPPNQALTSATYYFPGRVAYQSLTCQGICVAAVDEALSAVPTPIITMTVTASDFSPLVVRYNPTFVVVSS